MQKWEYCVITGVGGSEPIISGVFPSLIYFSVNGYEKIMNLAKAAASKRPEGMKKMSEGEYIAYTIARLGQEGWEMVGTGTGQSSSGSGIHRTHCIYFRRTME